tara:strand:+ start:149 stop:565 length:417 start_codon:yes stop_codon:yes gene_type:complete
MITSQTSKIKQEKLILSSVENEQSFNEVVTKIDAMYAKNQKFWMFIETKHVEKVHLQYVYKIGKYLNNIRKTYPKHLQYTYIYVYDDNVFNLLYTLFTFVSKPIAKVTVIYYQNEERQSNKPTNIKKIKEYFPHIETK